MEVYGIPVTDSVRDSDAVVTVCGVVKVMDDEGAFSYRPFFDNSLSVIEGVGMAALLDVTLKQIMERSVRHDDDDE